MDLFRHAPRRVQLVTLFVASFLLTACQGGMITNEGKAMEPTLQDGERVLAGRNIERIDRGHIVIFRYPLDEKRSFVKRVVGLPGEEVAIKDGRVFINGQEIDEPYVAAGNRSADTREPFAIPAGEYFVLGDNRRNSSDSRHWGNVRRDLIWAQVPR